MNRMLMIPAGCCLFAFAVLFAAFHGVAGRETTAEPAKPDVGWPRANIGPTPSVRAYTASETPKASGSALLSVEEAEQVLTMLSGEYLRPWREWERSPRRLYSRAAPRPVPSIFAKTEIAPGASDQSDGFLVATITITTGGQSQPTPCVVNRISGHVRLFAEGRWLSEEEWLKMAPLP